MIIRGGMVVTADGVKGLDIAIRDGRITRVERDLEEQAEEIDATGLHVFPGGIDSHVHFNEPGRTEWEDIAHGSAALAAGGYTAFIDMPLNNLPVTTTVESFDLKVAAMERSARVDYGLWGGLVPGNLDQLEPLVRRGAMGFKAFMCPSGIDEFPAADERTLREGMKRIADLDSILLVHAEDPALLREPKGPAARDFVESRPEEAEVSAIANAIDLAEQAGCRLHIVHVSTIQGAELIIRSNHDVSGETCPHYMLYVDDDMTRLGGNAKCAPPFRKESMPAFWMVVSDHSPSTLDLKQDEDFRRIWGGISGCQSTRQLLLARDHDPPLVSALTSTNVARRFRIEGKGDIAPGFDADLWLVDLDHEGVLRREDLLYRNQFSVHEGQKIRGRTIKTLVRGRDAGQGRALTQTVN
jgi:allantoinase